MEFTPPETDFLTDSYSLENGGFANGGVLAGLKILHFRDFTVLFHAKEPNQVRSNHTNLFV